jgi:hypothetical protein
MDLKVLRYVVAVFCFAVLSGVQADAQVNVTQEHNNPSRDGVYVDAAFTPSAAANLTRDLTFDGTISGTRAYRARDRGTNSREVDAPHRSRESRR